MNSWVCWRSWVGLMLLVSALVVGCDQGGTESIVEPAVTETVDDGVDDSVPTSNTDEGVVPETVEEDCVSTKSYFMQRVWAPILSNKCMMCHNAQGVAAHSKLVLMSPAITGFLDMNYQTVKDVAAYQHNGESILLLKPSAQIHHGGGELFGPDSKEYEDIQEFVRQLDSPVECEEIAGDDGSFFASIDMLDATATWRKATLQVAGRRPTADEISYLNVAGEAALDELLGDLLQEDGYVRWVKETYNDLLLTDRYLPGDDALELLSMQDYPNVMWFDADYMGELVVDPTLTAMAGGGNTNMGVAREALELVAHVVRNGLPFSEILTAAYTVVNPYSQITYGAVLLDGEQFADPYDPNEFRPAVIPGVPHAGLLSSPVFLNRFPTTDTNRNRHRARMTFNFFLATDVLKLAERPVDPTAIVDHNPTMFNPQCTVCHTTIDPVAGSFQNWSTQGRYMPPEEGWYPDMVPPGFGETLVPADENSKSLRWLSNQITSDSRFATAALHIVFKGLTGQSPVQMPVDEDGTMVDYAERLETFEVQEAHFQAIISAFDEADQDHRTLVKGVIMSKWFRAAKPREELSESESVKLRDVGTARLLTPELLDRKIVTVTGARWVHSNGTPFLLSENQMMVFFGGINSDDITKRITAPNGLMASVIQRMSTEVACGSVAQDFVRNRSERKLFPYVDHSYQPEDANGFAIPGAVEAIYENIRFLHGWLLGEWLPHGHADLEESYGLFYDTWMEGTEALASGVASPNLIGTCQASKDQDTGLKLPNDQKITTDPDYTIRAWQAVMTYLMSDYRFIYE